MVDGITRSVLLAGSIFIAVRAFWIVRYRVKLVVRRWALIVQIPPALAWTVFYAENFIERSFTQGGLSLLAWVSRAAVFLTLLAWWIQQEVILLAERTMDTNGKGSDDG